MFGKEITLVRKHALVRMRSQLYIKPAATKLTSSGYKKLLYATTTSARNQIDKLSSF